MIRRLMCIFLILVVSPVFSASAHDNARIAIVNIISIEQNSEAWQKKLAQLEEQLARNRNVIAEKEKALRTRLEEYEKQRPLLSVEQQQEQEAEINQQLASIQNQAAEMNGSLDQDSTISRQNVRLHISKIIGDIAKERKLDLILEVGEENFSVVYYTERLEITTEVIERLNKVYPTIKIE